MRVAFYTATRAGWPGIYNRLVRWWTRSPYSHVELIFSDGMSASSSFLEGGVRFKHIDFDTGRWVFLDVPSGWEVAARDWFERNQGAAYDVLGNMHFVFGFVEHALKRWFCSEAVAEALGFRESWRYHPGVLYSSLATYNYLAGCDYDKQRSAKGAGHGGTNNQQ